MNKPPLIIFDPCRPWRYPIVFEGLVGSPIELFRDSENPSPECYCPTRIFVFDLEKECWLEQIGEELVECPKERPKPWMGKLLET